MAKVGTVLKSACLAGLVGMAGPAAANGLPDSVVHARILPGWVTSEGTRMAALRLDLAPGWKTYWRAPGDAGIPPIFRFDGSDNLEEVRVHWPAPEVFHSFGMRSVGYSDVVVLPIEISPQRAGEPVQLEGEVELGVCETVCVPVRLPLKATLAGSTSDPAIHKALAAGPVSAEEAGVRDVSCRFDPIADGMRLSAVIAMPPVGESEVTVVEAGDTRIWVSEAETERSGGELHVQADIVPPAGTPVALNRSAIRFTVLGTSQAVDIRGCTAG